MVLKINQDNFLSKKAATTINDSVAAFFIRV